MLTALLAQKKTGLRLYYSEIGRVPLAKELHATVIYARSAFAPDNRG